MTVRVRIVVSLRRVVSVIVVDMIPVQKGGDMTKTQLLATAITEMISLRDKIKPEDLVDMILAICFEVREND